LTRTSAPVGQFSWHEKACRRAPGGLSEVPAQRLHLVASRFSVAVTGCGGVRGARLSQPFSLPASVEGFGASGLRGIIVMAL
jgi:hypothetical protein